MNINTYLNQLQYTGNLEPNLNTLKRLQKAHLLHIPFENLDIHFGNPIALDINKIYNKVLTNGRGGFCYELNSLFNELLKAIGFKTTIISGRVYNSTTKELGEEYDHLTLLVKLNTMEYIVDVGFGEFTSHPLEFILNKEQTDPRGTFIIEPYKDEYYRISKLDGETKTLEYIFKNKERLFTDFTTMCTYHQTNPKSHFTQKPLISKATENGRTTITGNTLKITERGKVIKEHTFAKEEFGHYLKQWFNIDINKI